MLRYIVLIHNTVCTLQVNNLALSDLQPDAQQATSLNAELGLGFKMANHLTAEIYVDVKLSNSACTFFPDFDFTGSVTIRGLQANARATTAIELKDIMTSDVCVLSKQHQSSILFESFYH